ncbi:molecular chaperone DnaK [Vibrio alginolyticus]|uniref:molecular chaperone DnaK n=1 Tax=Vibrio TaxID=662 RepID=UPI00062C0324|nr:MULTISPECIES: molecular chaperone DnaK [Vibrio]MBT0109973.1 molecular chaperone DnaK [Vibrio alginolyticus]MCS0022737.1 molecular chaperone DnaK [Vibrio antiquarius]MDW1744109.1 molecular chaperone DnaK [Vibrio sp. Vb2531]MDW1959179.1 molecular chaperone DnaK [Vibrio sp. 661]
MNTKLVSQWGLTPELSEKLGLFDETDRTFQAILKRDIELFLKKAKSFSPILELLNRCYKSVQNEMSAERWVSLDNDIYFDKSVLGFWFIKSEPSFFKDYDAGTELSYVEDDINNIILDPINEWSIPNKEELLSLTTLSSVPFETFNGRPYQYNRALYDLNDHVSGFLCDHNKLHECAFGMPIPFLSSDVKAMTNRELFIEILKRGFKFVELKNNEDYLTLLKIFHLGDKSLFSKYTNIADEVIGRAVTQKVVNSLLIEDTIRADISPYHKKILDDTELGHWSLWQDEIDTSASITVDLPTKLVARDPKTSINDGVVSIDFGTKSTVVVYQKDNINIHPMRIGTGDLSKEIASHHYENPTIMEFINLESFTSAYNAKANKPYTRWKDLTISHTAQNSMQGSESSKFNTFLDEIKQWAGDKNRKLKIVGQNGKVIDLPPFLELKDDDFNPIEIYAYYLGLYINNLNNGIFMDYILSFPVTYEMPIRDKIIESFEKGLKKSLPAELGEGTINQVTVTKGASEPAAYALTALQQYGFDPEGDERVFYGVFDFGGGTTDFDFGIYSEPTDRKDKRRFDYVIEHFGAGGDKFLGGENLLELLAFEVFKKNKSALLEKGIQFEKHPERDAFAGSEQLLSNSQEARMNTKQLCIALRPFWEEHEDFSFDASGELSVTLTDINGVRHSAFALDIDLEELNQILSDRIERGVENFFDALRLAFSNSRLTLTDIDNVKIFLAGNSSQSSFVNTLFKKHIAIQHQDMGVSEDESRFELFAPLGTDKNDVEKPTGKTGVAFGLIESRDGGSVKVVDHNIADEDVRFKYYLGESRKKKFKPLIDREMKLNQWYDFIDAYYDTFEIFFTEQPSSSTGQMSIGDSSIKKKVVKLDVTNEEALVYIKLVSPTAIEYVVANEADIVKEQYLNEIQRIEL